MSYRIARLSALFSVTLAVLTGCGWHKSEVELTGQIVAGQHAPPALSVNDNDLTAHVSLVVLGSGGSDQIVAEQTLDDVSQLPIKFKLKVSHALLERDTSYGLRAEIFNGDGETVLASRNPVPVDAFDQQQPAKLTMIAGAGSADVHFVPFVCGDGFTFQLAHDKNAATVRLGNRQIQMDRAKSIQKGSTRYTDSHNDEIVIGNGITSIYFDGISHHGCGPQASGGPNRPAASDTAGK